MEKRLQYNLTEGNVASQLIRYAIPLLLTSLFQSMYSLVDILVAGNYVGSRGISAINNSSLVILLITKIAIGITQGGNIIIGQYFGAGEEKKKREAIGTLTLLSIVLGIISMIVFYFGAEWILIRLKAPALQEAKEYLQICAIGLGFVWLYNALSGILRAMGNSRMPMNCIIVSTLLNIVLDFLFVGGFSMGTAGAAYATVFSQIVSCEDTCQLLLSAMNLASSTMIAQNLGAKKYDRVMVIVNTAIKINLILALCTIVICQIFGGAMVGFFTNNAAAAAAGTLNLRIEIFGQIFYAIFLIYNSLSIGAGQSEFAMFNSFMNCIVVRIVLCYIFDKIWGLTGIYIACMAATFVSCPIGWIYAKSGCWKRDIVH